MGRAADGGDVSGAQHAHGVQGGFEEYFLGRAHLVRLARRLLSRPDDAEDVVQDVLARIAARWGRYSTLDNLDAYVHRAVVNACISHQRRGWLRWERTSEPAALPETGEPAVDGLAERDEMLGLLRQVTPNQRAVLVLRYYEGLSDPEIAACLGMSAKTVSSHASRGLQTLRGRLPALWAHRYGAEGVR